MNPDQWSPNLQEAVKTFSEMGREAVIVSLDDEEFVKSLQITDEELQAVRRFLEQSDSISSESSPNEWWM